MTASLWVFNEAEQAKRDELERLQAENEALRRELRDRMAEHGDGVVEHLRNAADAIRAREADCEHGYRAAGGSFDFCPFCDPGCQ